MRLEAQDHNYSVKNINRHAGAKRGILAINKVSPEDSDLTTLKLTSYASVLCTSGY